MLNVGTYTLLIMALLTVTSCRIYMETSPNTASINFIGSVNCEAAHVYLRVIYSNRTTTKNGNKTKTNSKNVDQAIFITRKPISANTQCHSDSHLHNNIRREFACSVVETKWLWFEAKVTPVSSNHIIPHLHKAFAVTCSKIYVVIRSHLLSLHSLSFFYNFNQSTLQIIVQIR